MRLLDEFREMAQEQIDFRDLLVQMTRRDLLLRYKQTMMGCAWAVFMPLINTAVFSVIFTRATHVDSAVPYPLFAYSGFLVWNFFASSLRFAVPSLTSNSTLVQKVFFPREILPCSAVLVCVVDLAVGSIVLVAFMAYYGIEITAAGFALPVIVAVHVAFTAGLALLLAMSNLFYRDIKYLFEVVITIWMFATPVIYPLGGVGGRLGMVLAANPMTQILEAYRAVLLYGRLPDLAAFGATAIVSLLVLLASWHLFHTAEFAFAENI